MVKRYFEILLPDGRNVNIMTTEGADAFLGDEVGGASYIDSNLSVAEKSRKRMAQNNVSNQERRRLQDSLVQTYVLIGSVADHASKAAFARVGENQLDKLVTHACNIFSPLATSKRWTKTGVLQKCDQALLASLLRSMTRLVFVERVMESDLMPTLARFCAGRVKTDMPCSRVTETILTLAHTFCATLHHADWDNEKIFKQLENSGMLAQVLRCVTLPRSPKAQTGWLRVLDKLMECQMLVKRKLKPGKATGDVLVEVIEGKSGYKERRDERVVTRLRNLQKMAVALNGKMEPINNVCCHCAKSDHSEEFQASLLVCSICKNTYYCSKECQVADWKKGHKKVCSPPGKALERAAASIRNTMMSFVESNYYDIMRDIVRITQEHNLDKQEVVLELSFFADEGSAPALREPPEFKVGITKDYLEGDRPNEPDWFCKGTHVYEKNVSAFLQAAADQYHRMTSDHLLTIVRYASGSSGVHHLMLNALPEATGISLFSDDAYNAFARAMKDDDSCLEVVLGRENSSRIIAARDGIKMVQQCLMKCTLMGEESEELMSNDRFRELIEEESDDDECLEQID